MKRARSGLKVQILTLHVKSLAHNECPGNTVEITFSPWHQQCHPWDLGQPADLAETPLLSREGLNENALLITRAPPLS